MHDPSLQAVRRAAAFESTVLENGLTVRVHTMPGFTRSEEHTSELQSPR